MPQSHEPQLLNGYRLYFPIAQGSMLFQTETDILPNRQRIEQGTGLEEHTELLSDLVEGLFIKGCDLLSIDTYVSAIRPDKSYDALDQDALANPTPPYHHHALAVPYVQVHSPEDVVITKRLVEIHQLDLNGSILDHNSLDGRSPRI